MPYRNILVGTDGSPTAEAAVAEAADFARAVEATLTVVAAYPESTEDDFGRDAWDQTTARQAEEIVIAGREIAARQGVRTTGRAEPGSRPGAALHDLAEEIGADLIVVGSKGMTGAKRFLLGSVPGFIAHHADCDVLIVRTID